MWVLVVFFVLSPFYDRGLRTISGAIDTAYEGEDADFWRETDMEIASNLIELFRR